MSTQKFFSFEFSSLFVLMSKYIPPHLRNQGAEQNAKQKQIPLPQNKDTNTEPNENSVVNTTNPLSETNIEKPTNESKIDDEKKASSDNKTKNASETPQNLPILKAEQKDEKLNEQKDEATLQKEIIPQTPRWSDQIDEEEEEEEEELAQKKYEKEQQLKQLLQQKHHSPQTPTQIPNKQIQNTQHHQQTSRHSQQYRASPNQQNQTPQHIPVQEEDQHMKRPKKHIEANLFVSKTLKNFQPNEEEKSRGNKAKSNSPKNIVVNFNVEDKNNVHYQYNIQIFDNNKPKNDNAAQPNLNQTNTTFSPVRSPISDNSSNYTPAHHHSDFEDSSSSRNSTPGHHRGKSNTPQVRGRGSIRYNQKFGGEEDELTPETTTPRTTPNMKYTPSPNRPATNPAVAKRMIMGALGKSPKHYSSST